MEPPTDAPSPSPVAPSAPPPRPDPGLLLIFLAFAKTSLTSFGGGVSAMMYAEFVNTRRWIGDDEFVSGLALSQMLPGINVTNLAIWIGYRMRGPVGAAAAWAGAVLPSAVVIVAVGAVFATISGIAIVAVILSGVAATAMGLALNMGVRSARYAIRDLSTAAVFAATVIGASLHISVVTLAAVLLPVSFLLAYLSVRREQG